MSHQGKSLVMLYGRRNWTDFETVFFKTRNHVSLLKCVLRAIHKRGDKNALALMTVKVLCGQTLNRYSAKFETPSNINNSALNDDTDSDNDCPIPAIDLKKYGTLEHMKIIRRENAARRKRLSEIINGTNMSTNEPANDLTEIRGDNRRYENPKDIGTQNKCRHLSRRNENITKDYSAKRCSSVEKLAQCSEHPDDIALSVASSRSSEVLTPHEKRSPIQRNNPNNVQATLSPRTFNIYPTDNDQVPPEQTRSQSSISTNDTRDSSSIPCADGDFGDDRADKIEADVIQNKERLLKHMTDLDIRKISYRRMASCLFMPFCRRYRLEIFVEDEETECLTPLRVKVAKKQTEASLPKMRTKHVDMGLTYKSKHLKNSVGKGATLKPFGSDVSDKIQDNHAQAHSEGVCINKAPYMNIRDAAISQTSPTMIDNILGHDSKKQTHDSTLSKFPKATCVSHERIVRVESENTQTDEDHVNLGVGEHAGFAADSSIEKKDTKLHVEEHSYNDGFDSKSETQGNALCFDIDAKKYGSLQHMQQIKKQNKMMQMRLQSVTHRKNNYVNPRRASPNRGPRNCLKSAKIRKCRTEHIATAHHGDTSCADPKIAVSNSDTTQTRAIGENVIASKQNTYSEKPYARIKSSNVKKDINSLPSNNVLSSKKHQPSSPKTLLKQRIKSAKQYGSVAHYQKVREINVSMTSRVKNALTKLQTWQPADKMESLVSSKSSQPTEGTPCTGKHNLKSWQLPAQTPLKVTSWSEPKQPDQKDHQHRQTETDGQQDPNFRRPRARPNVMTGLRETTRGRRLNQ